MNIKKLCTQGFIISGDVNAHAWECKCTNSQDDIGGDIMYFMDDNCFIVVKYSLPTYHSSFTNESDNERDRNSVLDATFLHLCDFLFS